MIPLRLSPLNPKPPKTNLGEGQFYGISRRKCRDRVSRRRRLKGNERYPKISDRRYRSCETRVGDLISVPNGREAGRHTPVVCVEWFGFRVSCC
jgi:hypothetical protein